MDFIFVPEWLKIVFIGWGLVSIIAAPIVGRFLVGALHENVSKPSDAPSYAGSRGPLAQIASKSIAAPRHRI